MLTDLEKNNIANLFNKNSELKKRLHFYFVSGALMTILLPPEYNNPFLLLIGINALCSNTLVSDFKQAIRNPAVIFPLIFWFLYLISVSYSEDKQTAFKEVEKLAAIGFFPLFFAMGPKIDTFQLEKLKWHFIISVSMLALFTVLYSVSSMFNGGVFEFNWLALSYESLVSGVGVQPLYFSMFIALALFFLFEIQRVYKTGIAQILLIVLLFIYMIMLSSRMTTLAFFAIFAVYNVILALKNRKFLYQGLSFSFFLITAMFIIVFNPVNKKRFEEALNPKSNYQTDQYGGRSIRLEKWKCSIEVFSQSPVLGVGAGDLKTELLKCYKTRSIDAALFHRFNSHNQYLNTIGQIGLPGLALLILMLIYSAKKAFDYNNDVFLAFVALFALCILSESMFGRRWGIFFFALFYSVFHFFSVPGNNNSIIAWIKAQFKNG
ncbi:MAG: O-antigen ligase family protein [Cytophagales bacterium]